MTHKGVRGMKARMNSERHSNDKAVMIELLTDLPSNDRLALLRFYVDGDQQEDIESAFGMNAGYFLELRRSVKAAFFERTGRGR